MTKISIALATYNGEKYIAEQLESLAAQTLLPTELVVCDDNSQDRTLEMVEAFAQRAPFPVRIYRNEERLGYRANFMKAAGLCTGDLIAFCDQDDVWDRQKLACVSCRFDSPEILLVFHNAWLVAADLQPSRMAFAPKISELLKHCPVPTPWFFPFGYSIVFRQQLTVYADVWKTSVDPNAPTVVMAHDQWFFFLASVLGKIAYVDKPLMLYRQHAENTCGLPLSSSRLALLDPVILVSRLAISAGMYQNHQKAAENRALILTAMCRRLDVNLATQLKPIINEYRELSERLVLRTQLYNSSRWRDRFRLICDIAEKGGYRNNWTWSFGRKALIRDLFFGVPFGGMRKDSVYLRSDIK